MDRRRFLSGLASIGVTTAVAACSDGGDEAGAPRADGGGDRPVVRLAQPADATLPDGVFALGVASGDPLADRVMLWTRLASAPTAVDGGSPTADVEVAYDVATDDAFKDLVASGVAVASAALGHSVHVDVTGLSPDTWFHYRFRASGQTSETGRTRTFPAVDAAPDTFRFVFASCQDLQWGRYPAWGRAAELSDVDAVVFLGDYIYEINLGDLSPAKDGTRVWAGPIPMTLPDYRMRYAQTKADPQLQAAHLMAPWIVTFDDHEVSNNYAGDVGQADVDQPNSRDRRLAAYQAWYEHTPIRIDTVPDDPAPDDFAELRVHRDFAFGSLARLFAIETRQHADPPPCREGGDLLSDDGPLCPEAEDPARTNLGQEQETWLADGLAATEARWNVLANPLMLAELNTGTPEAPKITRDTWSGYPASRQRLLAAIADAEVSNPVVVTGDWHASFVLDVQGESDGPTVMPEFVVSSISTIAFEQDYRPANPQVRYFEVDHGYAVVTVTPEQLECEFHYVDDVWNADVPISRIDRWVVHDGEHEATAASDDRRLMVDAGLPIAGGAARAVPMSPRRIGLAFTGLMVGNAMAGLDATIVATAATNISGDLGRLDLRFWFFTAYQLAEVAVLPLYAKLGDLFGRRRIFVVAVLTFLLGSILCGAAPGIGWFIAARVIQGIGAGGLAGLSMALVADLVPADRLGRYLGYAGLVFGVTSVLGPLAGGVFSDQLSWRWAFFVNVPFAIIGLVAVRFVPDHGNRRRHRLDIAGAALLVTCSTTAVLAANWGGREYAWGSPTIVVMLGVSVGSGVAFAWWQRRAVEPIIPPRVVRPRAVRASVTANLVAGIGFFVGIAYLPAFFESVAGLSATASGLLLVPFALSVAAGTVAVGQVVERTGVGTKAFPVVGMVAMAIGFVLLGMLDVDTPVGLVSAVSVIAGLGVGFVMQVLLHTVQTTVPPEDLGVGTAVTILARLLGGVVGVGVLGTIFNRALTSSITDHRPSFDISALPGDAAGVAALPTDLQGVVVEGFAHAVRTTFWVAVPIMLLGLVATLLLPTPSRS